MFKKRSIAVALACGALLSPLSQAGVVSMYYSGSLSNSAAYQGLIEWDTSTSGTMFGGAGNGFGYSYSLKSFSLVIGGVDYTPDLTNAQAVLSVVGGGVDRYSALFKATVSNPHGDLQDATEISLLFSDTRGRPLLLNVLPTDLDWLDHAQTARVTVSPTLSGTPDLSATPSTVSPPANNVPEPRSLSLLALAAAGLVASRRRATRGVAAAVPTPKLVA